MDAEIKRSTFKAKLFSFMCGVLFFCANIFVNLAAITATKYHENMAVVTSISNGTILIGFAGSYFVYKESINRWQILGSLACLTGILLLSLSVLTEETTDS